MGRIISIKIPLKINETKVDNTCYKVTKHT